MVDVGSGDHAQLRAGELVLEQPVTEVDGQVDLVGLADFHQVAVLVHVDRHKVVADFGCVLCGVGKAKFVFRSFCNLRVLFYESLLALH